MSITGHTTAPDGTGVIPLEALGVLSALSWSSNWPGGDGDCTLSLNLPADANPPGLRLGRRLTILDGVVPVWTGVLADPQRGAPWTVTAQGLASLGQRFLALAASSSNWTQTTNANTAVTNAISRGLPWTVPATLPTPTINTPDQPDVATLLDAVATASGERWAVDQYGQLTMAADPATPDYLLVTSNTPGGRTVDNYATALYSQATGSTVIYAASNNPAAGAGPFGRWERLYQGSNTNVNNALALVGPDPAFSGDITVLPGDLLTLGGSPVRLSTVRAGQMVRAVGVQPDPVTGQQTFSVSVNIVIGEWQYDAIADSAILTPLGSTRQDITTLLAAAASTTLQGAAS